MAIGVALMIGFKFPENFDNPYISQNITEFWRRWHMTLSRWMRDYLYIPLGGNRVSKPRMYLNLWLVFLISGFWHGASWNFMLWGAYHGFFLVADRLFLLKILKKLGKVPSIIFTFFVTIIGWVLFRIESLSGIKAFLKKMFCMDFHESYLFFNEKFFAIFFIAVFFAFYGAIGKIEKFQIRMFSPQKHAMSYLVLVFIGISLFILSLASITSYGFNPFIYFRF
jgi:alginate O-acetyltransferase complex protein AlgI